MDELKFLEPVDKKKRFLEYYGILPIQKLGAEHIGVCEDTITDWKKSDQVFSDQMGLLKSVWAKNTTKRVRNPEWLLERIMKDHFAPRQEVTGKDGTPLTINVISYGRNNSASQLPAKKLPTPLPSGDGRGLQEGGIGVAPESGQGQNSS